MFVQVIQGKVGDPDALRDRMNVWISEVKPGAAGWLGATGGVTDDGEAFIAARFESREAAERNSQRPEQGAWWEETAKVFDGDATFTDYEDVKEFRGGGSDDSRFVQVMQGRTNNLERLKEMDEDFDKTMEGLRPDLIGGLSCVAPDGTFTSINYFTSEDEARENEAKELPQEAQQGMNEFMSLVTDMRFIDLKQPWLHSP